MPGFQEIESRTRNLCLDSHCMMVLRFIGLHINHGCKTAEYWYWFPECRLCAAGVIKRATFQGTFLCQDAVPVVVLAISVQVACLLVLSSRTPMGAVTLLKS